MKLNKIVSILLSALLVFGGAACTPSAKPDVPVVPGGSIDINALPAGLSSDPARPSTEKSCTLYYKAGGSFPFAGFTDELYVHIWIRTLSGDSFVQSEWAVNTDKCKLAPTEVENVWKLEIGPSIREWFGAGPEDEMTKIGVVVRNADGSKQTEDLFVELDDAADTFVPAAVVKEPMPSGTQIGINYLSPTSVCVAFYDKDTEGKCYDHCFVLGDFNNWKVSNSYQMKRDESKGCWWYTFTGLTEGKEYRFQYQLIDTEGESFRTYDPYTEITYDGDDKWISSTTYPNLPSFPANTSGIVGAFQTSKPAFEWKNKDFKIKDKNDLVIYELHFRDFSATHDINGALEKLDYLENLGINAIELMPCQEFDGNDSWGYNPRAYFALDKAYGTREMYKHFIDECHSRGIAVLLDVVYNHTTGVHPMARLYWNSSKSCTAENNPWYNVTAPHPYSVYHDLNHENLMVREHIKRSLVYLMDEYRFDGFRFDLTKGFTQRKCNDSNVGNYDASRIAILKDYASAIFQANPNAVMICEHFCETREENELAQAGMQLWKNMNNAYCQTAMGWLKDGDDLGWMWSGKCGMPFGSLVGFMESHDEERTAYKAVKWGNGACQSDLAVRMQRLGLNAAFSMLIPGPKMIWQFGELGYDISIEEGGRTSAKPIHWEYYDDASRKGLYDTYAKLLEFRFSHPSLFASSATFTIEASSGWTQRALYCTNGGDGFVLVGNFDTKNGDLTAWPPFGGKWRDVFTSNTYDMPENGERKIVFSDCPQGTFHLLIKE